MRHAKRTDANHSEIRKALRGMGFGVLDLSASGGGVPDLMVRLRPTQLCGKPHFLELKDGDKPLSAQALTPAQEAWHSAAWRITSKVTSLEEAVEALEWAERQP